jgi:FRG domain
VALKDQTVTSINELFNTVLDIGRALPDARALWYRGHSCSGYTLIPALMRGVAAIDSVFDRERRLLTRFRQRSLPYWPTGYPQTDWEHMFAMQHHGVPTRLLDWTENLFVGLYFAVASDKHGEHGDEPNGEPKCLPVIWCLDPVGWNRGVPQLRDYGSEISVLTTADDELDPYKPESTRDRLRKRQNTPVAVYGTHNTARIVAQRGTFTVAGKEIAALETFADIVGPEPVLWRISIDSPREGIRHDLGKLGFTETMIFPDLPGLARELDASERWQP